MVIDLNKCIGCQTCTVACKTLWTDEEGQRHMFWNSVNTQPGRGTPKDWETMGGGFDADGKARSGKLPSIEDFGEAPKYDYDKVFYQGKGAGEYLHPPKKPKWMFNWDEDQGAGEFPNSYFFYLPRLCNHCTYPACAEACPIKAIYKRKEDGIVLVDQGKCRGYRYCMEACPYKKIYFNYVTLTANKCIFCFPRLEKGVANACARQCPGRVRFVGYLDDTAGPIHKLVNEWKVAIPLHPEYGTEPNIYYVPPIGPARVGQNGNFDTTQARIPIEYLQSLFGPNVSETLAIVQAEMDRRRKGEKSELMDILIGWRWPDDFFKPFTNDPVTAKGGVPS
ncbi:MAG: 4Fe-4S dicluster domain-containing protein [Nitrospirae bacterium]|nr:4Fe-4S dicluster domain-containing protein [Nitrospirota bacterium]